MEKNMFESLGKDILKAAAVLLAAGGEMIITPINEGTFVISGIKHPSQCGISFPTEAGNWTGGDIEITQKLMQALIKACL